jgi:hypothetical protein
MVSRIGVERRCS